MRFALFLLAVGCGQRASPLADFNEATLSGSSGGLSLSRGPAGCPPLADSVTATADGAPMLIARGGSRSTTHGTVCDAPTFSVSRPLQGQPTTSFRISGPLTTWSIDVTDLGAPAEATLVSPADGGMTAGGDAVLRCRPPPKSLEVQLLLASSTDSAFGIEQQWTGGDLEPTDGGVRLRLAPAFGGQFSSGEFAHGTFPARLQCITAYSVTRCEGPAECDFGGTSETGALTLTLP